MSAGAAYAPWALRTRIDQQVVGLHDRFQAPPFERGEWYLAYGNGRSYGDSCLNIGHHIVPMRSLDRMMDFDAGSGVLTCEAGVTLEEVLRFSVPRGWFLPRDRKSRARPRTRLRERSRGSRQVRARWPAPTPRRARWRRRAPARS